MKVKKVGEKRSSNEGGLFCVSWREAASHLWCESGNNYCKKEKKGFFLKSVKSVPEVG
jgi:hypothetical protein